MRLAGWLRPDAWAVIRMVDRSAGTYLRGFVRPRLRRRRPDLGRAELSPQLGGPTFGGALALATLAGLVQLVPELGPILGLLPALLLLPSTRTRAVTYVAAYVAARVIAGPAGRPPRARRLRVHPAILIPGVVVLGQLGSSGCSCRRRSWSFGATSSATSTAACPSRRDRPACCPASRAAPTTATQAGHGRARPASSIAAVAPVPPGPPAQPRARDEVTTDRPIPPATATR